MKFKQSGASSLGELVFTFVVFIFLIIIFNIFSIIWKTYQCNNYGSLTERTTKYSIINGCFVKTKSGWIPKEEMSKRAYGNSIVENN